MDINPSVIGQILGAIVAVTIIWGVPLGFILSDPIISKKERIIWVFATVFVSWFAWLLYLWVAPVLPREKHYD